MSSSSSSDDEVDIQPVEVKVEKPKVRLTKSGKPDGRSQSSRNNIQRALQQKINLAKNKINDANIVLTDSSSDSDSSSDEEIVKAPKKPIKLKKEINQAVAQVKSQMRKATKHLANPPEIPPSTTNNDFKLLRDEIDNLKKQLTEKSKVEGKPVQKPNANDLAVIYRNIMRI